MNNNMSLAQAIASQNPFRGTIQLQWSSGMKLENVVKNPFLFSRGIYVIWYWKYIGNDIYGYPIHIRKTVKVGQGWIKSRLQDYNRHTQEYYPNTTFWVTWATVSENNLDGVEKYVGDKLHPTGRHPNVDPIQVNLPWLI